MLPFLSVHLHARGDNEGGVIYRVNDYFERPERGFEASGTAGAPSAAMKITADIETFVSGLNVELVICPTCGAPGDDQLSGYCAEHAADDESEEADETED